MRKPLLGCCAALVCLCLSLSQAAYAQEEAPCDGPQCDCCEAESAAGPAPGFSGCLWCRPKLTGDWHGKRTCLAEKGITLDADLTQFYFGTAQGGVDQLFRYGAHGDYVVNVDGGKLGVQEGLFIKLRAEHRFGEALSGATGALLPSNVLANLPVANSEDLYLTNVMFTQALSERFAVFAGKIDTLDGDANAYAHGRGKTQFSNMAFVVNPAMLRTVPYSTLATGFIILRDLHPLFTFSVFNATDTTRTSGFDELFAEGAALNGELRLPTTFLNRPGHQLFGGVRSSRNFVALDQDPRIILPQVPIARQSGSWGLYWNFDQTLVVDPCDPAKGWGVFGRAAVADDEANPLKSFLSFGIGGNSPIDGRSNDTFGIGWYVAQTSGEIGPILQTALGPIGDGQGVELYYNYAYTPWLRVTPDLQIIEPARQDFDTALVLGLRVQMDY